MGSDVTQRLTLYGDGTYSVLLQFDVWNSGDQTGPEFNYGRTDTGTYVREGNSAIVFTITSSACIPGSTQHDVDRARELVGTTVRCPIVDGQVTGYPVPEVASYCNSNAGRLSL
jgi:hypothetical protein